MYMSSNGGVSTRTYPSFFAHDDIVVSCSEQIIVASTTLMLFAGRFGLAPSANRKALAGLKLVDRDSGLQTGDPAGFTATDTLACGVMGHIIGVGIVLGLKGVGVL
jgi:photosystem I subunit 10